MKFKLEDQALKSGHVSYDVWVHNIHGQLDRVADSFWSHNRQDWVCPVTQDTFTDLGYTFLFFTEDPERPSDDMISAILADKQQSEITNELYDGMVM